MSDKVGSTVYNYFWVNYPFTRPGVSGRISEKVNSDAFNPNKVAKKFGRVLAVRSPTKGGQPNHTNGITMFTSMGRYRINGLHYSDFNTAEVKADSRVLVLRVGKPYDFYDAEEDRVRSVRDGELISLPLNSNYTSTFINSPGWEVIGEEKDCCLEYQASGYSKCNVVKKVTKLSIFLRDSDTSYPDSGNSRKAAIVVGLANSVFGVSKVGHHLNHPLTCTSDIEIEFSSMGCDWAGRNSMSYSESVTKVLEPLRIGPFSESGDMLKGWDHRAVFDSKSYEELLIQEEDEKSPYPEIPETSFNLGRGQLRLGSFSSVVEGFASLHEAKPFSVEEYLATASELRGKWFKLPPDLSLLNLIKELSKETSTNQKEKPMSMKKSVPVVDKGVTLINGVRASEISDESLIFEISQLKAQTEALKSSMEGLSSSYIQAKVDRMEQTLKDLVEVLDSRTVASLGSVSGEVKAKAEDVSGAKGEGESLIS